VELTIGRMSRRLAATIAGAGMAATVGSISKYLLMAALMLTFSFRVAAAAEIVDPWADFLTMPTGTSSIHA